MNWKFTVWGFNSGEGNPGVSDDLVSLEFANFLPGEGFFDDLVEVLVFPLNT